MSWFWFPLQLQLGTVKSQTRLPLLKPLAIRKLAMFLACRAERLPATGIFAQISNAALSVVTNGMSSKTALVTRRPPVPTALKISQDDIVYALRKIFEISRHRKVPLTRKLEHEVYRKSEIAANHTQEVRNLRWQLESVRKELGKSEGQRKYLVSRLQHVKNELQVSLEEHGTARAQLESAHQELREAKAHKNEAAADHAQSLKRLEDLLEYTRDELTESENKHDVLFKSLKLFQEEDKDGLDITKQKGSDCKVCATKSNEMRKLRRANRSMARQLADARVTVEQNLNKMAAIKLEAEGNANEDGVTATELLRKREEQMKILEEEFSSQSRLYGEELDRCDTAKTKMQFEVDRLTQLCHLRDTSMAALKEANSSLLDKLKGPGPKMSTQHGIDSEEALTIRIETLERLTQEKLEELATVRVEEEEMAHQFSKLERVSEALKRAKVLADAEVDKVTWIAEIREQELEKIRSRHAEDLQERESVIESLKKEKDDFVKMIPQGLDGQTRFSLETKIEEIDSLRGKVSDQEDEIKELEEKNRFSHVHANVYEMLHARLDQAQKFRDIREAGRAKLDRSLRQILEERYGADVTQELYDEALAGMPKLEGEMDEEIVQ